MFAEIGHDQLAVGAVSLLAMPVGAKRQLPISEILARLDGSSGPSNNTVSTFLKRRRNEDSKLKQNPPNDKAGIRPGLNSVDLLDASDKIKIAVEEAKRKVFPDDIEVTIFNDQSIQTRNLVSNLEK